MRRPRAPWTRCSRRDRLRQSRSTSVAPGTGTRSYGDPIQVARDGVSEARHKLYDVVIVDTAGRLAIDEVLMRQAGEV